MEYLRIAVAEVLDRAALTYLAFGQHAVARLLYLTVARGDRMPVRIVRGIAQHRIDLVFELLRDVMLELLRFVVQLPPRESHDLAQVRFEQAVMTDDLESNLPSRRREAHALVAFVSHKAVPCQALDHCGYRCRGNVEFARDFARLNGRSEEHTSELQSR